MGSTRYFLLSQVHDDRILRSAVQVKSDGFPEDSIHNLVSPAVQDYWKMVMPSNCVTLGSVVKVEEIFSMKAL